MPGGRTGRRPSARRNGWDGAAEVIYAFGEFELDEDRFQLRWRSEPLDLEPKIFEVLAYLISNRDRVVPKQELLDTLWHDQIVGDWYSPAPFRWRERPSKTPVRIAH